ncbi:hypothetical protein QBC47DRAFT_394013 [Echria macrotheca]|uniref:CFEM domain-containing protein n=1 Tax=Echria macrotheca TaxID=438768 RepID=A0AAJ0B2G7_9PEZI|nr:hypothetical protein QBC47DRAFT_394013 [Echria macrotheca]
MHRGAPKSVSDTSWSMLRAVGRYNIGRRAGLRLSDQLCWFLDQQQRPTMRSRLPLSLAVWAAISTRRAVGLTLPTCAQTCLDAAIANGVLCNASDAKCLCSKPDFVATVGCCISQNCSVSDQDTAVASLVSTCAKAGTVIPSTATCVSTTSTGSSTSSSSTERITTTLVTSVDSITASSTFGTAPINTISSSTSSSPPITTVTVIGVGSNSGATSTPDPTTSSSGLSAGALAGIVVGAVGGVAIIILIIVIAWRRRRRRKAEQSPAELPINPITPAPPAPVRQPHIAELSSEPAEKSQPGWDEDPSTKPPETPHQGVAEVSPVSPDQDAHELSAMTLDTDRSTVTSMSTSDAQTFSDVGHVFVPASAVQEDHRRTAGLEQPRHEEWQLAEKRRQVIERVKAIQDGTGRRFALA